MNLAIFDVDGTLTDSFGFDAHYYDVDAARELGWNFVGRSTEPGALTRLGATHVLRDYLDVEAVLVALLDAGVPSS